MLWLAVAGCGWLWLAVAGCGWLGLAVAASNPKNATLLREWCGSEPSDMLRIRTPLEAKCHFYASAT